MSNETQDAAFRVLRYTPSGVGHKDLALDAPRPNAIMVACVTGPISVEYQGHAIPLVTGDRFTLPGNNDVLRFDHAGAADVLVFLYRGRYDRLPVFGFN